MSARLWYRASTRPPPCGRVKAFAGACGKGIAFLPVLLCLCVGIFSTSAAQAAYLLEQPPAELQYDTAVVPARANVVVTRFEKIGFYRYDPGSSDSYTVYDSHFADSDSLSGGTPSITSPLPPPLDDAGNPIPLDQPVPLTETTSFSQNQPLFVVLEQPLLPASDIGTRPDGRRFVAVTVDVDTGSGINSYIISLVETAIGSGIYSGYLQPDPSGSPVVEIPGDSTVSLRYDDYGELADSATTGAPSLVSPSALAGLIAPRSTAIQAAASGSPLFLSKQVSRATAQTGDFIAWRLELENSDSVIATGLTLNDRLPPGFRYQSGSLRVNGQPVSDPSVSADGRGMNLTLPDLAPGQSHRLQYVTEVGVGAEPGPAVNTARANASIGDSNTARAKVEVNRTFFNDSAFLVGRVIVGECGAREEPGLEGVRFYLEDGTNVITDKKGRWHMEGVRPGLHVLRLDEATLPEGYRLRRCEDNARKAGSVRSRFIDVQGGTLWRENWYLEKLEQIDGHLRQRLQSKTTDKRTLEATLSLKAGNRSLHDIEARLYLPDDFTPEPDSVSLDGKPVELARNSNHYVLSMDELAAFADARLAMRLVPTGTPLPGDKSLQVITTARTANAKNIRSIVDNRFNVQLEHDLARNIVLRPRFSSLSAQMDEATRQRLEDILPTLEEMPDLQLSVSGHTDSLKIRPGAGGFANNQELSAARAQNVADYLADRLALEREEVVVEGRGAQSPIADNTTEEGRARNRRVEIRATGHSDAGTRIVTVTDGDSGEKMEIRAKESRSTSIEKGFSNITDGMTVAQPVISVTAVLDSRLKPRLRLDGEEVAADRLGMKAVNEDSGTTRYTWVGLELAEPGSHNLTIQGLGPFGNARFEESAALFRLADIKQIDMASGQPENTADGRTPVAVKLDIKDSFGREVRSRTDLRLLSGELRPLNAGETDNPLNQPSHIVQVDSDGIARFEPVGSAGTYRIRLGTQEMESRELEVEVKPHLRDWILVGFAEGSLGYNTLRGNMKSLADEEEHLYTDGEASFFARGRVKGEWLLTAAYDSRRQEDDAPLNQAIDPQAWYVLYGDDTTRQHDAASREKLYLRIERDNFYALFGDYQTGLTVTELSRYNRSFTGLKSEYRGDNVSVNAFATETDQGFIRDDIRGDGTSGLYQLSATDIVPGSEGIRLLVRDRFTNEVIGEEGRTRFIDYNIDYDTGTIWFKKPVPVQDASFNPIYIVAEYETEAGEENIIGGGRVAIHDREKKLEVGITAVQDETQGAEGQLAGADLTWQPDDNNTVRMERARTRQVNQNDTRRDDAWLAEHQYQSDSLDTRVKVEEQQGSFGLGQQAASEDETRLTSASARYRWSERLATSIEASRQELLDADNKRDQAQTRMEYNRDDWSAFAGLRQTRDHVGENLYRSDQFIAGTRKDLLDDKLSLSLAGETELGGRNDNIDFPNRLTAGADYRLNSIVTLFGKQELSWGPDRRAQESRAGLRATPWRGGTISTEVGRAEDEFGPQLFAHSGLYQTLELSNHWSADFGFDRAQTLRDDSIEEQAFDPDRPLASGTRSTDYTALSTGLGYRDANWEWTNRLEFRHSELDDKWNLLSGFHHRLDATDTIAGRLQHFDRDVVSGEEARETSLDFSYSRRPQGADWFVLNRTTLVLDSLEDRFGKQRGRRLTNNTTANFRPSQKHQLALQYGARYVVDTIEQQRYSGYTDLMGAEYRYDLTRRWDMGVRGSVLHSWHSDQIRDSYGVMVGYSPIRDIWLGLGYNFRGFSDRDFDNADTRVQGIVFNFRIKFDEDSLARLRRD